MKIIVATGYMSRITGMQIKVAVVQVKDRAGNIVGRAVLHAKDATLYLAHGTPVEDVEITNELLSTCFLSCTRVEHHSWA